MSDKSKFQEITISRPEPAADDWFDLYDDVSKSIERYDKNLMLSDLHGIKEIGDEVTYYRRTRLKSQNCQHVYGTDYMCGIDPEDGTELPLWKAMKFYLLTKADLVLKMSRPRGGRILRAALDYPKSKERYDRESEKEEEEKGGIMKQLFKRKEDKVEK